MSDPASAVALAHLRRAVEAAGGTWNPRAFRLAGIRWRLAPDGKTFIAATTGHEPERGPRRAPDAESLD